MNLSRQRQRSSRITLLSRAGPGWIVRMTGTASEDQEPICQVFAILRSANLRVRPKAVPSARAKRLQLTDHTSMSAGVSERSGQPGSSSHRQEAVMRGTDDVKEASEAGGGDQGCHGTETSLQRAAILSSVQMNTS